MSADVTASNSTKRRNPFLRLVLLPALIGVLISLAVLYVPPAGWLSNDVTTGKHSGYPDLQPRRYDSALNNTTILASAAAATLRNWKVVETAPDRGLVRIEVRDALLVFKDDVTVTITPTGTNGDSSEVVIRSHSRIPWGDLGENARHIRALQAAMDDKLPPL